MVAGSVAAGLTPDTFAQRVFAGIEADKFWILPQQEFKAMFQMRVDSILQETNPMTMQQMMELGVRDS